MAKTDKNAAVSAVCLRTCEFGEAGDVVELTAEQIAAGKAAGALDDHPDAVAYAIGQKGE